MSRETFGFHCGFLLSVGRDEPGFGCFDDAFFIYCIVLFAFRFFQQSLQGKIVAQSQGAEQLPGRLPREPRQSLPPAHWLAGL